MDIVNLSEKGGEMLEGFSGLFDKESAL